MAGGHPLFELFVRIKDEGVDGLNKKLTAQEAKLKAYEDRWNKFAKEYPKQQQENEKALDEFTDAFGKLKDDQDDYIKAWDKHQKKMPKDLKKNQKSLGKFGDTLGKIKKDTQDLSKKPTTIEVELKGDKQVVAGLEAVKAREDSIRGDVVIELDLRNDKKTIASLEEVEGLKKEIDGDKVTFTVVADGTEKANTQMQEVIDRLDNVDGRKATADLEVRGAEEATAKTEKADEALDKVDGRKAAADLEVRGAEEATAKTEKADEALDKVDGRRATADIEVQGAEEATAESEGVSQELDTIDGRNVKATVNVSGPAEAITEMEALKSELRDVDGSETKVKVDHTQVDSATGSVDKLAGSIRDLQEVAYGAGIAALISNIASLATVASGAVGAILGLASAIGSGLVGAAVAASGAIGTLASGIGLLAGPISGTISKLKDFDKAAQKAGGSAGGAADKSDAYASALDGLQNAQDGVIEAQERLTEATEKVGEATEKAREMEEKAIEAYTEALDKVDEAEKKVADTRQKAADDSKKAIDHYYDSVEKVQEQEKKLNESRDKLRDATQKLTEAQADLNRAMRDEPTEQKGAELDLADARLSVKEATQGITDAEARLAEVRKDPKASPEDLADAELGVERARLSSDRATNNLRKTQSDYNETVSQGSKNLRGASEAYEQASDQQQKSAEGIVDSEKNVTEAREDSGEAFENITKTQLEGQDDIEKSEKDLTKTRVDANKKYEAITKAQEEGAKGIAQAQKGVEDAQRSLEKANRAVEAAQRALNKSMDDGAGSAGGLTGKTIALTAAQMRLYEAVKAFIGAYQEAFAPATDILADLGVQILELAQTALPRLGTAATETANTLTTSFENFRAKLEESSYAAEGFETLMDAIPVQMGLAADAAGELGIALFTVFSRSIPYATELLTYIEKNTEAFREWTQSAEGIEKIDSFMASAVATAKRLWGVIQDLGVALKQVFDIMNESGMTEHMLANLESIAQKFRDITAEGTESRKKIDEFLTRSIPIMDALGETIEAAGLEFLKMADDASKVESTAVPGMSAIEDILRRIKDELIPAVGEFFTKLFEANAPGFADLVTNLSEFFQVMADNADVFAVFLDVLNKVLYIFDHLPDPVQSAVVQLFALHGVFKLISALPIVGTLLQTATGMKKVGQEATTAKPGVMGLYAQLLLIYQLGSIVVDIAINWNTEAAQAVYDQAIADGDSAGRAYMEKFMYAVEQSDPTGLLEWFKNNVSEPLKERAGEGGDAAGLGWWEQFKVAIRRFGAAGELASWILDHLGPPSKEAGQTSGEEAGTAHVDGAKFKLDSGYDEVNDTAEGKWDDIGKTTEEAGQTTGEEAATAHVDGTKFTLDKGYDDVNTTTQGKWDEIKKAIFEKVTGIKAETADSWSDMNTDADTGWGKIVATVEKAVGDLYDWLVGDSKIPELVDRTTEEWQRLDSESDTEWGTNLYNTITSAAQSIYDEVIGGSIFQDLVNDTTSWWETLTSNSETEWGTNLYNTITSAAQSIYDKVVGGSIFPDLVNKTTEWWQTLVDSSAVKWGTDLYNTITSAAQSIYDKLVGQSIFPQLVTDTGKQWDDLNKYSYDTWSKIALNVVNWAIWMSDNTIKALKYMYEQSKMYLDQTLQAAQKVTSYMSSHGGPTNSVTGAIGQRVAGVTPKARGGIEDNAQAQPAVGGVSDGMNPRVVYGEQKRTTKEAYIVEDRDDQLPYLSEAASWHGYGLMPMDGMARGGINRHKKRKNRRHNRKNRRQNAAASSGGASLQGLAHQAINAVGGWQNAKRMLVNNGLTGTGGGSQRRAPGGGAPAFAGSAPGGSRGSLPSGGAGSGAGGFGGSQSANTGNSQNASGSGSIEQSAGATGDINITTNITTGGSSGMGGSGTGGSGGNASADHFPTSCGSYPVTEPTPSDQLPYLTTSLENENMKVVFAGGSNGFDHVNTSKENQGPNVCAPGNGASLPWPFPSTPETLGATNGVGPYGQCGPSFAMASGGTLGGSGGASNLAYPVPYQAVPVGWWDSFMGYQWYGDPSTDWDVLFPPGGWDPSAVYSPAETTGFAKGGIVGGKKRNGVSHFEGGGLSGYQVQAAYDAGSSVLGYPYMYGEAGENGGYDCAGLWNWIEAAVIYGAPQVYKRWGTEEAYVGDMSGTWESGALPGGVNVGVSLTGWGDPMGDDTHMAGDVMDTPFESNSFYGGVLNGNDHTAFDAWWTLGSAADMANQVGPGSAGDPNTAMNAQIDSWWACQQPLPFQLPSSPMFDAVENWMAALPGMTQSYLQGVGSDSIGTLGTGDASGGTVRDWAIAGLEANGYDASEDAIAMLSSTAGCESNGDPSVTNPESGAMGLMQLMPDTWSAYTLGGDPYDPIANMAASINYQIQRYGTLVDACAMGYYANGGMALGPHVGVFGEDGTEAMLPLENRAVMAELRSGLGTSGMSEGFEALRKEVANVSARIDHQTVTVPAATGTAVKDSMNFNLKRSPNTRRASIAGLERETLVENIRGG